MPKQLIIIVAIALFGPASASAQSTPAPLEWITPAQAQSIAPETSEECCRICKKGKACGDSCIARDKQCHKPPGCACDG
jgi:hypothetical protein